MKFEIDEKVLLKRLEELKNAHFSSFYDKEIDDNQIIETIKEHIDFNDVTTILLRGSRSTGRSNPYSDVDVIAIVNDNFFRDVTFKDNHGVRYNIKLYNMEFFSEDDNPLYRTYYGMRVIYGNKESGEEIINKINKYEEKECNNIVKKDPSHKKYLYELLEFIDDKNPNIASFAKAKLLSEYPAYLAHYNGFNLVGFKVIIDCLVRDNYSLASVYQKALDKKSSKEDIKELIDKSFDELCGINVLNTNFKNCKTAYDMNIYNLYNDYYYFIEYLNRLKPKDMLAVDFYIESNKKAPKLFDEFWSLIN